MQAGFRPAFEWRATPARAAVMTHAALALLQQMSNQESQCGHMLGQPQQTPKIRADGCDSRSALANCRVSVCLPGVKGTSTETCKGAACVGCGPAQ
jgi:hypothetical protein